jgi:phosphatidate cytidylyltransferase
MKNILARLLVFLIGVPLIFVVVVFLPQFNHLALNCVVVLFCAIGAVEFAGILRKKNLNVSTPEAVIFGGLIPFTMLLYVSFGWTPFLVAASVLICAAYCLICCALSSAAGLKDAATHLAAGFSVILYPGLFFGCTILMSGLSVPADGQTTLLVTCLFMVFASDGAAWLFGMLFGRNNKGFIAASPNKSIAGFIAGIAASIIIGVWASSVPRIGSLWNPDVFMMPKFSPNICGIILGLSTGVASIVGDLAESAIKRSTSVKDSGILIPGRGGVLDSIDSLSLAAPGFFIVYNVLFRFNEVIAIPL